MPIQILPPEVASQIAAGEVIERPASVVKELIENAIDAGADIISIITESAGCRLIEVSDNGCGISSEELPLAIARHATSKLHSAEDLFNIRSLGFRGEALASIGSVANVTVTSRTHQAEIGARLRVEGGRAIDCLPTGAPPGTVVRVENLFYNVPARLKFLKSNSTERSQIDVLVTRYALAYPMVRMTLRQEGRTVLQTSGNGDQREILAALYGADIARHMLEILADYEEIHISGFISPISITRSNRREITFFVNGRPVQDAALTTALVQAYQNLLMVGRFPLAVLFLRCPPEAIDVNVHPTKAEVRFRDRDQVFSAVQRAVRRGLLAYTPVPTLEAPDKVFPYWKSTFLTSPKSFDSSHEAAQPTGIEGTPGEKGEFGVSPDLLSRQGAFARSGVPLLRLVGQLASTYLVAEGPDGLYLIDQHAAHERVLFERFLNQRGTKIPSQTLLQPVSVNLPPAKARLLEEQLSVLSHIGFEVEIFGSTTFLVRSIPSLIASSDPAAALNALVEDFEEDETPFGKEIETRLIARVCKRAAVKAGQLLSPEEQHNLLQDLEACASPRTCPHGRPTMVHLSVDILERQFGRRGAR